VRDFGQNAGAGRPRRPGLGVEWLDAHVHPLGEDHGMKGSVNELSEGEKACIQELHDRDRWPLCPYGYLRKRKRATHRLRCGSHRFNANGQTPDQLFSGVEVMPEAGGGRSSSTSPTGPGVTTSRFRRCRRPERQTGGDGGAHPARAPGWGALHQERSPAAEQGERGMAAADGQGLAV